LKRVELHPRATTDIDKIVARIHRDIGDPKGKVDLAAVRHVLKLDLSYYRSSDDGLLREVMHKIQVGAKQVIQRPTLLIDAIRKFDLRALILPDKKKILLDQDQPPLKLRWNEAHEISHGVLPWHVAYAFGDNGQTLSPQCHETIEAEANWGAGRLLFPSATFSQLVAGTQPSLKLIETVEKQFGNTKTSTLWRVVEQASCPSFGVIGAHPQHATEDEPIVAHFIQSSQFAAQFPELSSQDVIAALRSCCGYGKKGPIGSGEVQFVDANGNLRKFRLEIFSNGYQCLSVGCE
jgi:Zn-dependent peptidase ImmA (M78 family)